MTLPATSTAEYDAFGPWIDEVRTEAEIPRLFRDRPWALGSYRLVLKIPRNIARRDATPDMDLYDHVVAVGPSVMTVLSRQGAGYCEQSVAYDRLVAIVDSVDLLDGRLEVYSVGSAPLEIGYGGSSRAVVTRLIGLLRELSGVALPVDRVDGQPLPARQPRPALRALGDQDVDLVTSFLGVLADEPGLWVRATRGRTRLTSRGDVLARAVHWLFPMVLHGCIVCGDDDELQVLSRRTWVTRGATPVRSLARTVILRNRLEDVTVAADPRYEDLSIVTLHTGGSLIDIPVPTGSDAERALVSALVRPPGGRGVVLDRKVDQPVHKTLDRLS